MSINRYPLNAPAVWDPAWFEHTLREAVGRAINEIALRGNGTPEGAVRATPGTLYLRLDGGTGTSLYVKETGNGLTGWVAK